MIAGSMRSYLSPLTKLPGCLAGSLRVPAGFPCQAGMLELGIKAVVESAPAGRQHLFDMVRVEIVFTET